eukprot:TRINITY_DN3249_c0_g1_i1.p1 TRINITY_DN3249_c0_g1~~TRINITY_DN3249_c0_g1_i1.p1  ORF type:complete len:431 (+),score=92.33 TRINITY_DN3249_c0_g1_i1:98-1294(+)
MAAAAGSRGARRSGAEGGLGPLESTRRERTVRIDPEATTWPPSSLAASSGPAASHPSSTDLEGGCEMQRVRVGLRNLRLRVNKEKAVRVPPAFAFRIGCSIKRGSKVECNMAADGWRTHSAAGCGWERLTTDGGQDAHCMRVPVRPDPPARVPECSRCFLDFRVWCRGAVHDDDDEEPGEEWDHPSGRPRAELYCRAGEGECTKRARMQVRSPDELTQYELAVDVRITPVPSSPRAPPPQPAPAPPAKRKKRKRKVAPQPVQQQQQAPRELLLAKSPPPAVQEQHMDALKVARNLACGLAGGAAVGVGVGVLIGWLAGGGSAAAAATGATAAVKGGSAGAAAGAKTGAAAAARGAVAAAPAAGAAHGGAAAAAASHGSAAGKAAAVPTARTAQAAAAR